MIFLRQWGWAFLLIAFSLTSLYASGIDNGVSHDRLKYLSIAWGMYHSGNYFIPMVNGEMYTDKPPLIFWLIALFWHMFGVSIVSVTLMISLVLVSWGIIIRVMYATLFPKDLLGKNMIAFLLLGSSIIWKDPWFLRVDMLLVLGVSLCNLGILQSILSASSIKTLKNDYSFFCMVLGTLIGLFSKGPVFYIFTLLPFCLTLVFNQENRYCASKVLVGIFIGTCLMLISWVIPAIIFMGSEFAHQVLYQQITHRAVHVEAYHIEKKPYLIYLYQYMPMLFFPWIINLIFFKKIFSLFYSNNKGKTYILTVFVFSFFIFTAFGQKSAWYILPLFPFGLIFFTRFLVIYKDNQNIVRLNIAIFTAIVVFFLLLCGGLIFFHGLQSRIFHNFGGHFSFSVLALSLVAIFSFFVLLGFYFLRKNLMRFLMFACMMVFLIYGVLNLIFDPFEKEFTRIVPMSNELHQQEFNHEPIALYQFTYLGQFDYAARLTQSITVLTSFDALKLWLKKNPRGAVIIYEKNCGSLNLNLVTIETYRERKTVPAYSLCRSQKYHNVF